MSYLTCPSCLQNLSVSPKQLGRAMPCPLCQTLVVAVESAETQERSNSQEKQLVLIQAPIVLDVTVAEPDPPKAEASNHLSLLLTCPSCNNDLQLDESRLAKPFRCPLCFRLLIAEEASFSSKSFVGSKRFVLKKAPPQQGTPADNGVKKEKVEAAELPGSGKPKTSSDPGIWPTAPVAQKGKTAVAAEVALYGIIYLSLVGLLFGVYRQDQLISSAALLGTIGGCTVLLWRGLKSRRDERNVRAQFRSLAHANNKSTHWLGIGALALLGVLLIGNGIIETFMAIQTLESPNDLYLVLGLGLLACLVGISPLLAFLFRHMRFRFANRVDSRQEPTPPEKGRRKKVHSHQ
jgi:hypothetical protein